MHIKRYWLLVVLIPFCVLAIGTYYVSGAGDQKPDYYLETIKGQEIDGASLLVQGQLNGKMISISTQGTESESEQLSYLERLDTKFYYQGQLNKLLKENRSFMRGKSDVNAFYEDDKVLAYVAAESPNDTSKGQSNLLKISVKWKLEKKNANFEIQADKRNDEIMRIYDVQVKDQVMKVLINRQQRGNNLHPEFTDAGYDVYTIDLLNNSLLSKEKITANTQDNAIPIRSTYVWASDIIGPNGYAIFDRSENKKIDKVDSQTEKRYEELVNREILVYDLWNGKWQIFQNDLLHNFLMEDHEMVAIQYTGQELSLISISEKAESRVMRVNFAENKEISDVKFSLQAIQKEWGRANWTLRDKDRLYLLMYDGRHNPLAAIVELQTGNMIYQAEVQRKDDDRIGNLNVNGLHVKK